MPYKVVGPHAVLDSQPGEYVDLSSMTNDEVRTLIGAGHVALVEEEAAVSTSKRPAKKGVVADVAE